MKIINSLPLFSFFFKIIKNLLPVFFFFMMEEGNNEIISGSSNSMIYADALSRMPPEFSDYDNLKLSFGDPENYVIHSKLGRGRYSEVFLGFDNRTGSPCVIKSLKPIKDKKLNREIKVLQNVVDNPLALTLLDIVRDPLSKTISLITDYSNNVEYHTLYRTFTETSFKTYFFKLAKVLDSVHSVGIMHRDVKPGNVMFDPQTGVLKLIDWGLAEFYRPGTEYSVKVSTRYYKGPELLLKYTKYDYSVDMWSYGCVLLSALVLKFPFFKGFDETNQLEKIVRVIGSKEYSDYLVKYSIHPLQDSSLGLLIPRKPWESFVTISLKERFSQETMSMTLDLVGKLLVCDPQKRLSAAEVLKHPLFEEVNKE